MLFRSTVQIEAIHSSGLLAITTENRGLINPFTQKYATPSPKHDLLNFRAIREREFLQRITSMILKQPSVNAPKQRHRLQTFSERKINKRRVSELQKNSEK